jgi:hypothetical protein
MRGSGVPFAALVSCGGWRSAVAAMVSILVVGCMNSPPQAEPCPSTYCQTLKDPSPGQLALFVSLNEEQSSPSMTSIRIEFTVPVGGKPVAVVASEQISCDGVAYTHFPAAFGRDVSTSSIAGRTVNCLYSSGQHSAKFAFSVPNQLEILTPRSHERVHRGPSTTVTYKERHTTLSVLAVSSNAQAGGPVDATTMTSAVVDTRSLQAGDGYISIAEPTFSIDVQGDQFQSVGGYESANAIVFVVWV